MQDLPDAPWIRDAEINGLPFEPEPVCPCCGAETERYYLDRVGDIIGCECCISTVDAYDYQQTHEEDEEHDP